MVMAGINQTGSGTVLFKDRSGQAKAADEGQAGLERSPPADVDHRLILPLAFSCCLSSSRHAHLICDEALLVLWHSPAFEQIIELSRAIRLERGRLFFANRAHQRDVDDFLADPAAADTAIVFGDAVDRDRFTAQLKRLGSSLGSRFLGMQIADRARCGGDQYRHSDRHFHLTRQEARVCRELLNGQTAMAIAGSMESSRETIRFHIQNIYRKMQVSSREELFVKLRPFLFG